LAGSRSSTGRFWIPWWAWAGAFVVGLLLILLGLPALMASSLAKHFSWPFWLTYLGVLVVCYVVVPLVLRWLSGDAEGRLRRIPCGTCRTVPGDRAVVKRSGRSLLVICPRCGEVGSMQPS